MHCSSSLISNLDLGVAIWALNTGLLRRGVTMKILGAQFGFDTKTTVISNRVLAIFYLLIYSLSCNSFFERHMSMAAISVPRTRLPILAIWYIKDRFVVVPLTVLGMVLATFYVQTGQHRLRWWALPGNVALDATPEGRPVTLPR